MTRHTAQRPRPIWMQISVLLTMLALAGAFTITPATPGLPAIEAPVTIDGTTQPGFTCCPIIELNGTSAGGGAHGLAIFTGSTTIRGLVINRFGGNGILMQGAPATGNVIGANYIGLDVTGTTDLGNGLNGVAISGGAFQNTVGGDTQSALNRLSGNNQNGVIISGSGSRDNKVQSNFIGTDVQGTSDLGNTLDGVRIDNAPNNTVGGVLDSYERNVISGNNGNGVSISGASATGN